MIAMNASVQLATARQLQESGSVQATTVAGQRGGYAVRFTVANGERVLATKAGHTRLFSGVDAAAKVLRTLGIARYTVDASALAPADSPRQRPDRAKAMKQTHEDAAYLAFLVECAELGRADPVRYTNEEAKQYMRQVRAKRDVA